MADSTWNDVKHEPRLGRGMARDDKETWDMVRRLWCARFRGTAQANRVVMPQQLAKFEEETWDMVRRHWYARFRGTAQAHRVVMPQQGTNFKGVDASTPVPGHGSSSGADDAPRDTEGQEPGPGDGSSGAADDAPRDTDTEGQENG